MRQTPTSVYLLLTHHQVRELAREAHGAGPHFSDLLSGLLSRDEVPPFPYWERRYREDVSGGDFSLSALKGLLVLTQLLEGEPIGVKALAEQLQMKPTATHRYLKTLLVLGLVEQDPRTHKYRLGGQ
jgi:hypothetical protein